MKYIIYDLEATCWLGRPPKGYNEIIEIGAVKINEFGEVEDSYESFVKPKVNPLLSGFCKKLTSITQDQINRARQFNHVIQEFQEWTEMYEYDFHICSWGQNDKNLFASDCELHKIDNDWLNQYINLKNQYDSIKGRSVKGNLKKIVMKEGFEFTGKAHRAISDAENLAKIFLKYFDEWTFI